MKKVIGIVSEGPTDHMVLKAAIDRITGEENRPILIAAAGAGYDGTLWQRVEGRLEMV